MLLFFAVIHNCKQVAFNILNSLCLFMVLINAINQITVIQLHQLTNNYHCRYYEPGTRKP